jgi:predicted nucleic acid-binding protein
MARYAYLDASVIVKLVVAEPETAALEHALLAQDGLLSSRVSVTEVVRASRRGAPRKVLQHAEAVLESFFLLDVTPAILDRAARLEPTGLRTLDAIHLASASSLQIPQLDFITYDFQLARAADALGLRSVQPGLLKKKVGHR